MAYVIGGDVGGTFTDAVLDDDAGTVLAAARRRQESETAKRAKLAAGELGVDMYGLRDLLASLGVAYEEGDAP